MTAPKTVVPLGKLRTGIDYITIGKEYPVASYVPPSLCWIRDDENELIAIIVPSLHPEGSFGGHHNEWEVVA